MNTLSAENSLVLIIDIQERVVAALNKDIIVENAVKIASAAKALDIPVLLSKRIRAYCAAIIRSVARKQ